MFYPIILIAILLAGCETSPFSKPVPQYEVVVVRPQLEPAPEWMTKQCPPLPKLPRKELPQAEVEKRWSEDARLYHECRTKHAAHVRWTRQRDETFNKGAGK